MLDYPVTYYGIELNTVVPYGGEGKRRGCLLEEFDYGNSRGVGYSEKRAQDDGLDASDVYMGARYINLTGIVYGSDPGDLHDRLQDIRTALTPTVAYAFDPYDFGYIPLEFTLPTNQLDDFPTGFRDVEFRARPVGQPSFSIRRDMGAMPGALGGAGGGAIQWRASLECKDPRMYVRPDKLIYWHTNQTGVVLRNRGDYPAPVDVLLILGAASSGTSKVDIDIGNANLTIALGSLGPPASGFPSGTIIRYSSELKVLTVQIPGDETDTLRMDLLSFRNNTTHPLLPPGNSSFSTVLTAVTLTGTGSGSAGSGTRFIYSESFA
jgi:hypothetical protein